MRYLLSWSPRVNINTHFPHASHALSKHASAAQNVGDLFRGYSHMIQYYDSYESMSRSCGLVTFNGIAKGKPR